MAEKSVAGAQRLQWACWATMSVVLTATLGCGSGTKVVGTSLDSGTRVQPTATSDEDVLARAFDFLHRLSEFEPLTIDKQINYLLSRWLNDNKDANSGWVADELLAAVPVQAKELVARKSLRRRHVTSSDVRYVKECVWLKIVAKWAVEQAPEKSLPHLSSTLQGTDLNQLKEAQRLFEWTIRNVQLAKFPKVPQTILAGGREVEWHSKRGRFGPGYTFGPWRTIIWGRGDGWQRARSFMALARQRGIDTVMLAIDRTEKGSTIKKHEPWLTGVIIGKSIYLFDARLGLPIPGKAAGSIATLAEVQADPSLIRKLDIGTTFVYPVKSDELKQVVALLAIHPDSVARRWFAIERRLVGKHKTVLTQHPSRVKQSVLKCQGKVNDVAFWSVPFKGSFYRTYVYKRLARSDSESRFRQTYYAMFPLFREFGPLLRARLKHLSGKFSDTSDKLNAKALYMSARVPDEFVRRLYKEPQMQKRLRVFRHPKWTDAQWRRVVVSYGVQKAKEKMDASYWIGLIHFESGNFAVAAEWFDGRLLSKYKSVQGKDPLTWRSGASFNLARAYEALGKVKEARQVYLSDETLTRYSSLLRARMLKVPVTK